ncbi:MAG: serine/threonine protein kinase [Planctomycetaceae bacterium]|nr:serine/threonine protein kinase [Planctomycetaceae bacterium]
MVAENDGLPPGSHDGSDSPSADSHAYYTEEQSTESMDEHSEFDVTQAYDFAEAGICPEDRKAITELNENYEDIILRDNISVELTYQFVRRLGAGGQGVVYLTDRAGAFGVNFPLALKFHRVEGYQTVAMYRKEMARLARVSMEISRIQQDHLLDIYNVVEFNGILVLVSEWVDGLDIRQLMSPRTLQHLKKKVDPERYQEINDVVVTNAGMQSRFKVGIAISILRECLAGLSALHREGIVHADVKPSNIMVKRSGNCKIIDPGSAYRIDAPPSRPLWTPRYAAVEVLEGAPHTPLSDLASLGYVLFEMLTGTYPFAGTADGDELVAVKTALWEDLEDRLPEDLRRNKILVKLIKRMIAPRPEDRFSSLDEADHSQEGASEIQRQLVVIRLASEYHNDLRVLMDEIGNEFSFDG